MSLNVRAKREALWKELESHGFVTGEVPLPDEAESPWYVRVLIGFSAWLAALFLLGFVGTAFEFVFDNPAAALVVGSMMIFLAYMMLDKNRGKDFACQFGLAISFAGQALVGFGLFDWGNSMTPTVWLILVVVQAGLAVVMPNSLHRTWSAFAAASALSFAFISGQILYIQTSIIMMAVTLIWLNEFKWIEYQQKLKPIGYGLTLALLYQASTGMYTRIFFDVILKYKESMVQPWVGELLLGIVVVYLVWALLKRQDIKIPGRVANAALLAALMLIIVSLEMFGITVGVMVILLGYANGNRILTSLGIASLLYSISAYYYLLHSTLLVKSQWLAILGILLLIASGLIRYVLFKKTEFGHAK